MVTLEQAIIYACTKHEGQTDRGGNPYVLHLIQVMMNVETLKEKIVAVLHDVIEDTNTTADDLYIAGFSEEIVKAVLALTKYEGETRISAAHRAAANRIACAVKLADVAHNMDLSRLVVITDKDVERQREYEQVKEILEEAKVNHWHNFQH